MGRRFLLTERAAKPTFEFTAEKAAISEVAIINETALKIDCKYELDAAGTLTFRLRLSDEQAAELESWRARISNAAGEP